MQKSNIKNQDEKLKDPKQNVGFTLLEVIIATAIFTIIAAATMEVIIQTSNYNDFSSQYNWLNNTASNYTGYLDDLLPQAKIIYVNTTTHSAIQYQLPLSYGPPITWGAYDSTNTAQSGWYYTLIFVADNNLDEATGKIDYNADGILGAGAGDQYFQYGHINLITYNSANAQQSLVRIADEVLVRANSTYAELDYKMQGAALTAVGDPLFKVVDYTGTETAVGANAKGILIDIWFALTNPDSTQGNYIIQNTGDWIALQNPQT